MTVYAFVGHSVISFSNYIKISEIRNACVKNRKYTPTDLL